MHWIRSTRAACAMIPILILGVLPHSVTAQEGWGMDSPFAPLAGLPSPNTLRTGAGRPGPDYWQQRVDYRMEAAVDTDTHLLTGSAVVRYHNNSPHALAFLWLKIDANLCDPGSENAVLNLPPLIFGETEFDWSCSGGSGITIDRIAANGRDLTLHPYGTVARLDLPHPLPSGGTFSFEMAWRWTIPVYGYGRMDREGTLYQVAQWYPRVAVYDDLSGWNIAPFLGAGEFYQEYGDFRVALTVPDNFVVAATGTLDNPESVLTAAQRDRLANAAGSNDAVAVITRDEALAGRRARARGTKIWRFSADNVRDFAFAMAPDFRWDASTWDGIAIQTFYRPEAALWEEANRMSWVSIKHFSERLYRYPWPHATTIEGPNGGMEYPMLTFVPTSATREDLYWVLTHEFGHEWFPMIVNSNERLHPWMDEGFNTFIDIGSVEAYFAGEPYADEISIQPRDLYAVHALADREQPMALPPDEQHDLYWAAYFKPALMLHLLRTEVLGPERFDRAFSEYTHAWAFKHPGPADFIRFMEDAAGKELDWFWRGWVYSTARLDQAVMGVYEGNEDGQTEIRIRNRGAMVMPAELALTFGDGATEVVRLPVEMWKMGRDYVYRLAGDRELVRAELDPRGVYPDDDRSNNVWSR